MPVDRGQWPLRRLQWIDVAWIAFAVLNLAAMMIFAEWETVPFHFIWVSLTLLYGFRVWALRRTMVTLAAVMVTTTCLILIDVSRAAQPIDEITEVPLMAAMFLAMVWHARRRASALDQMHEMYEANTRMLERERRFIQDASHELRTPVTVALGHAELIQKAAVDPLVAEDARVVMDELLRLRRLADRLLLMAASEHPDFLHRTRLDVETTVVDTVRRWAPVPRRWVLDELEEAVVDADPDRLALALDALVDNAVKHTTQDDSVTFSVRLRDGMAVISVADTGEGVAPEDLARIFDRFARSDPGRSREGGGMGLGLAIVKTVAEAHGGSVAVQSDLGAGTVFELALPLARSSSGPTDPALAALGTGTVGDLE
jgi:signal transduction histidine kinase